MFGLVKEKDFSVIEPGACLTSINVSVHGGYIAKCELHGSCEANLKILAHNLTGEKLSDAVECIDYCCNNDNVKCVKTLNKVLKKWFKEFEREYHK